MEPRHNKTAVLWVQTRSVALRLERPFWDWEVGDWSLIESHNLTLYINNHNVSFCSPLVRLVFLLMRCRATFLLVLGGVAWCALNEMHQGGLSFMPNFYLLWFRLVATQPAETSGSHCIHPGCQLTNPTPAMGWPASSVCDWLTQIF